MNDQDNTLEILAELKKVISDLKKEDREFITEEIKPEILSDKIKEILNKNFEDVEPHKEYRQPLIQSEQEENSPNLNFSQPIFNETSFNHIDIKINHSENDNSLSQKDTQIPKDLLFRIALIYPIGGENYVDLFMQNLMDTMRRTTKKEYCVEKKYLIKESFENFEINKIIKENYVKDVEGIIVISKDMIEPLELENGFNNVYAQIVNIDKINKRFIYVDITVELLLSKKTER